jgi:hypothetical protein
MFTMVTSAIKKLQLDEVFCAYRFAQSRGGHYHAEDGWYPLLGVPGSLDAQRKAVLFCRLQPALETEVQRRCLNGVIDRIRIHRSARVKGPDSMLVLASDLLHEFEICQVPLMTEIEIRDFIDAIHAGPANAVLPA